jgi:hypothetical protein
MGTFLHLDMVRLPRLRYATDVYPPYLVGALFAALGVLQALGFLLLGTRRTGLAFSDFLLILMNLLALACIRAAFRRASGIPRIVWSLFGITF